MAAMVATGSRLSAEGSRLFRIRKTCLKMLQKRGYVVDEEQLDMTKETFIQTWGENPTRDAMTILAEKSDNETDQIFVFFPEDEKVGVKPIKTYCDRMKEEGVHQAIIVVKQNITPFAKTALAEVGHTYKIMHFRDSELLVDITEPRLVPQHEPLTDEAKKTLLQRYKLKDTQLPRIQASDPIARYYGLKQGQVVKIVRPSETAGRYVTYRICI